jgi:hypothetical protein
LSERDSIPDELGPMEYQILYDETGSASSMQYFDVYAVSDVFLDYSDHIIRGVYSFGYLEDGTKQIRLIDKSGLRFSWLLKDTRVIEATSYQGKDRTDKKWIFEYESDSLLTRITKYSNNGEKLYEVVRFYNDHNLIIDQREYNETGWHIWYKHIYNDKNLLIQTQDRSKKIKWDEKMRSRSSKGREKLEKNIDWGEHRWEFVYDERDSLIRKSIYNPYYASADLVTWVRNENGYVIEENYWMRGKVYETTRYERDENNLIQRVEYNYSKSGEVPVSAYSIYHYNKRGFLERIEQRAKDVSHLRGRIDYIYNFLND